PREPGVGVRRAQERRVEHPRERHVVDVARLAPQEPRVLPPPHRRAEIPGSHRASSTRLYIGEAAAARSTACGAPSFFIGACARQRGTRKDGGGRLSRAGEALCCTRASGYRQLRGKASKSGPQGRRTELAAAIRFRSV